MVTRRRFPIVANRAPSWCERVTADCTAALPRSGKAAGELGGQGDEGPWVQAFGGGALSRRASDLAVATVRDQASAHGPLRRDPAHRVGGRARSGSQRRWRPRDTPCGTGGRRPLAAGDFSAALRTAAEGGTTTALTAGSTGWGGPSGARGHHQTWSSTPTRSRTRRLRNASLTRTVPCRAATTVGVHHRPRLPRLRGPLGMVGYAGTCQAGPR